MEDSIISHSNGMSSAMPNLIIMTDSQDNFHQKGGFQLLDLIITEHKSHMTC